MTKRSWLLPAVSCILALLLYFIVPAVVKSSQYGETKGGIVIMKAFKCGVCGFVSLEGAPEKCPVCGSPQKAFKESEVKTSKDIATAGETEKKHIPKITINKKCGMFADGCTDVFVKIGEITHPMLAEHYIMHIDFYIDDKYVARQMLSPDKINPAACLHVKAPKGKLSVIEQCNIHGDWYNEEVF